MVVGPVGTGKTLLCQKLAEQFQNAFHVVLLTCGRLGNVEVDVDGRTSIPHVFAGGDVATGAATVILAMGAAKTAVAAMNRMLRGEG